MDLFKRLNALTLLIIVAVFALMLRIVDIAKFPTRLSHAEGQKAESQEGFSPVKMAAAAPASTEEAAGAPSDNALASAGAAPVEKKEDAPAAAESAADSARTPPVSDPSGDVGFSAAEIETLQSLARRRSDLDQRERQISQKEALLKASSGEIDRKIAELTKIRAELEDLLAKQKTTEDNQYASLVKIYENMKPKDAANIFNTLEMEVLLPVIGKINERKASPILAAMNPEKAREVTIKLAEQRKLPGGAADKKGEKKDAAAPPKL